MAPHGAVSHGIPSLQSPAPRAAAREAAEGSAEPQQRSPIGSDLTRRLVSLAMRPVSRLTHSFTLLMEILSRDALNHMERNLGVHHSKGLPHAGFCSWLVQPGAEKAAGRPWSSSQCLKGLRSLQPKPLQGSMVVFQQLRAGPAAGGDAWFVLQTRPAPRS